MIGPQGAALGWIKVAFQAGIKIGQPQGVELQIDDFGLSIGEGDFPFSKFNWLSRNLSVILIPEGFDKIAGRGNTRKRMVSLIKPRQGRHRILQS